MSHPSLFLRIALLNMAILLWPLYKIDRSHPPASRYVRLLIQLKQSSNEKLKLVSKACRFSTDLRDSVKTALGYEHGMTFAMNLHQRKESACRCLFKTVRVDEWGLSWLSC